jgi:KDO2-lipid IV(A) lauroyltransferase
MFSRINVPISKLGLSKFFQLSFNVNLARLLPFSIFRIYIYLLGIIYFMLKHQDRRRVMLGIKYVFSRWFDRPKYITVVFRTFLGIFDHYYEKLIAAYRPEPEIFDFLDSRLTIRNKRPLDEIVRQGLGVLLVTGHFGALELLPHAMALRGYKVSIIVRFKTAKLKEKIAAKAKEYDVQLIDANEPKVIASALKALRNGRILITECDEFKLWCPCVDQYVSVFGNRVPRDKTLDFFYRHCGMPAFLGLMRRNGKGYFTLCLEPLAGGEKDVSLSARAWSKLEKYIMNYPEQWYQWKNVICDLANYIDWEEFDVKQEGIRVPTEYPVLSS